MGTHPKYKYIVTLSGLTSWDPLKEAVQKKKRKRKKDGKVYNSFISNLINKHLLTAYYVSGVDSADIKLLALL